MSSDRSRFASEGYLWHECPAGFCTMKAIDRIDKFVPDADHFERASERPLSLENDDFLGESNIEGTVGGFADRRASVHGPGSQKLRNECGMTAPLLRVSATAYWSKVPRVHNTKRGGMSGTSTTIMT